MKDNQQFCRELTGIALPVTLQCLLQSSFGVIDQIMTGQLGSVSIAGIGIGSKFTSLFTVLISAISAVAGIMIAQYVGKKDRRGVGRSFFTSLAAAGFFTCIFIVMCIWIPDRITGLYTEDVQTVRVAAGYLRIFSISYLPMAVSTVLSAYLRCMDAAVIPLYTSAASALLNTGLNYILIFGELGFPRLGTNGAALASVIAQLWGCILLYILFIWKYRKKSWKLPFSLITAKKEWIQYAGIIVPMLICEFFWSLGDNVYASIYGHIGTQDYAAMTLTNPIQALMIGALSGVAQAAGIMIGKSLGAKEYEKAYRDSKLLMLWGAAGSAVLSVILVLLSRYYALIFNVEESVRFTAQKILFVFALISPVKVQNMILGGGIIRSGGKTAYIMVIDLIGTWVFGVPLGLLSAFVWDLPIAWVYFFLSLEECVRLGITLEVFRRKKWMKSLEG